MKPLPSITALRGGQAGADVYVLGSGATLNHLDRAFFDNKVVVSVNSAARIWGIRPSYVVLKDHAEEAVPNQLAFPGVPIVVSQYPGGGGVRAWGGRHLGPDFYVFPHLPNRVAAFDADRDWPEHPDWLVVSWSTITSAMHFAAYLGARNIIVVGHDCGTLGGERYVRGYPSIADQAWLTAIEAQSIGVKRQLQARYGCNIYSLSPFLNYALEGVPFRGTTAINVEA